MNARNDIYIEVSTLLEPKWTGISNVTASLCEALIRTGANISYFAFDQILKPASVRLALQQKTGAYLSVLFEHGFAVEGNLHSRPSSKGELGIFPNFKRAGEDFRKEVLIVHDLSFVLTPEFHPKHRISDYVTRVLRDARAVDAIVCVSESTKRDLVGYFKIPNSKITVSHLGVTRWRVPTEDDIRGELARIGLEDARYFLQLGTIEPRKNIDVVFRMIQEFPHWLASHKFVFAGKYGWGPSFNELLAEHGLKDKQVVYYDYVSDYTKHCLLHGAKALLFPSWFEGFGLPVIEAMAAGTVVVGSASSSIVEAGGQAMISFDPSSASSLNQALVKVVNFTAGERQSLVQAGRRHAEQFTWEHFGDDILAAAQRAGDDE